jgi:hypothetical protein
MPTEKNLVTTVNSFRFRSWTHSDLQWLSNGNSNTEVDFVKCFETFISPAKVKLFPITVRRDVYKVPTFEKVCITDKLKCKRSHFRLGSRCTFVSPVGRCARMSR